MGRTSRLPPGAVSSSNPPPRARAGETPAPLLPPDEPLQQQKYLELIRKHLGKVLDALFAEFTGVHFHIAWKPASPRRWDTETLPTGCSVCCRLTGSPLLPACRICGPRQLARALSADGEGHCFTCRLGVRNYWIPIRVRAQTLGFAYLQALDHSTARRPTRVVRHRLPHGDARLMDRPEFTRSARFLQLIVQHVQTASLADLREADLTSAGRAVLALEKEQAWLRETLKRHMPPASRALRRSGPETHPEQVVQRLLECIERNYGKPITLQHCADKLGMNPAYLSDLFSRAVGVPFKAYLTELRMEKARELLSDPAKTAAEVAYAVGYASENRFRIAFKKATGLCPRLWRETMQTNPRR